ncbi:MAG: hypothetical protein AAGL89_11680, partial [Pseudomonadota bacterium]
MSAIQFVVRDVAGNLSRGSVAGEGASSSIIVGAGADVSLNLTAGQILSYTRQGQALQITLIDGRVITIEGYFAMDGVAENTLFLSADGYMTEVQLQQGAGADYFATYAQDSGLGKFAANDDLYFVRGADVIRADAAVGDDDVGMLATALGGVAPFLGWGGAAAVGTAVIAGVDGGSTNGPPPPVIDVTGGVEGTGDIINQEEHSTGVVLTGVGTPEGNVTVTIGDATTTTIVDQDGNWSVTFPPEEIPTGEYDIPVDVVIVTEGGEATTTETLVVDTVIGASIDASGGADGVINAAEYDGGITLTGTVTGNDQVTVTIGGVDYEATVVYDATSLTGTWSLDVPTSVWGEGEYSADVTITTTDAAGNSFSTSGSVEVDTLIGTSIDATGGADGVINISEAAGGVTLTGTVTGNDAVTVTVAGVTHAAAVVYDEVSNTGTWALDLPSSLFTEGEYDMGVTVTTTDAAGNTATTEGTIAVDTLIGVSGDATGGADGVVNAVEYGSGVVLTGSVTGNDAVTVTINGQSYDGVVSYDDVSNTGTWSLAVPTSVMGQGEYSQGVTVTTTDAAGNSASTSMTVEVDTLIGVDANATGGADGVINGVEYGSGVVLTGAVADHRAVGLPVDRDGDRVAARDS